ncbi:Oligopeptide transporter 5 [Acorus gramineus]|uniref:Oligopeptide transporter 5 n=1 Tax=Acorus gramineus TaxID=55184 RepID=A0AAV9BCE7_ACOGR|nr:Oligopeptide transporter 5 [Acorus gramineus]
MKKNYAQIPQWWFYAILIPMIILAIFSAEMYKTELQVSFWSILLASGLALICILPMAVIDATTGQYIDLKVIFDIVGGYLYHGRPLAKMTFGLYGTVGLRQALLFLRDFKMCHYMKIPPRSMFLVQIMGTLISTTVQFFMQWYILSSVKNICEPDKLPKGSPWTCPFERQRFMNNVIWGLVGPAQVFFPFGQYSKLFISFVVGVVATIFMWFLARRYPDKQWIKLINIPLILSGATGIPPATTVNYWSWFTVGVLFNYIVYRRYKGWWAKYNYVLSNALDAGCAFMALLVTGMIQLPAGIYGIDWWGLDAGDHCPLASCPTAPGVVVDGCPIIA